MNLSVYWRFELTPLGAVIAECFAPTFGSGVLVLICLLILVESVFKKNRAWARIGEAERARRQASEAERGRCGVTSC